MAKSFVFERKVTVIIIRFTILLLLIFFVFYSPADRAAAFSKPIFILLGLYLLSQFILALLNQEYFFRMPVQTAIFLFDTGLLSLIIYFTQGFNQDLYLIYFLTIFMASMGKNNKQVLLVAVIASLFYSGVLLRTIQNMEQLQPFLLLRIPFLFLVALFSNFYMVQLEKQQKAIDSLETNKQKVENKILAILNQIADGTVVTDKEFNVLMMNPAAETFFNVAGKTVVGRNLAEITEDLQPSRSWKELRNSPASLLNFDLFSRKGNPLNLSVLLSKAIDEKKGISSNIMIIRDITWQKREELLKKNFLSAISHRLKAPITAVISYISVLHETPGSLAKLDEEEKSIINGIEEKVRVLSRLVDKLLAFSALQSESPDIKSDKVKLHELIDYALRRLDKVLKADKVSVNLADGVKKLPEVYIDKSKIAEVFLNLFENAVKFNSKENKTISVSALNKDSHFVQVEIKDNGNGIRPEEKAKIFQGFHEEGGGPAGRVEGVSLGLSLCKKLVELNNGQIWLESTPGAGTSFFFTLPIAPERSVSQGFK